MTLSPSAKPFDWRNLGVRLLSALVLAPAAVLAAWFGGPAFLMVVGVGAALLAIEWAMMSAPRTPTRLAAVITAFVVGAVCVLYSGHPFIAWVVALVGAGAAAAAARIVGARTGDAGFGVLYLAAPALALIWLRGPSADEAGRWWTLLVLTVAWAADGAAFLIGSTLRGPKVWPRISPNKTWSGLVGGVAAGAGAAWGMTSIWGVVVHSGPRPDALAVTLAGGLVALATMAGDFLESMLKRRFGVKDSGDLIPGHGGLLDRVDGLMTAVLAVAAIRSAYDGGALAWL